MKTNITRARVVQGFIAILAVTSLSRAEDVEKKFRIGISVGTYDTQDEVGSDSANVLQLIRSDGTLGNAYEDPGNDAAALGSLQIETAFRTTVSAQYAFNKLFVLEGSVGYQKGDVGNIETQAQFDGERYDTTRNRFNFHVYDLNAGQMTQIPLQVTALARFRPKSIFNPYFGAGVGYTYVGFTPSAQLNSLSLNMDSSTGRFAVQEPFPGAFGTPGLPVDLAGATIDAPDTFEWHLAGGAEFGFHKKWSAIIDARYTWASGSFHIGFNGTDAIGVSIPQGLQEQDSVYGTTRYGTYAIAPGLIDGGCRVPTATVVPGAVVTCAESYCAANPTMCVFVRPGGTTIDPSNTSGTTINVRLPQSDGVPDPGFYYVKGGDIKYGGLSVQVGVRYTF